VHRSGDSKQYRLIARDHGALWLSFSGAPYKYSYLLAYLLTVWLNCESIGHRYGCRTLILSPDDTASRNNCSRRHHTTSSNSSRCLVSRSSGTVTPTSNYLFQPRSVVPSVDYVVSALYITWQVGFGQCF